MITVMIEIANWVLECMDLIESKSFSTLPDAIAYANGMIDRNPEYEATFVIGGKEYPYETREDVLKLYEGAT